MRRVLPLLTFLAAPLAAQPKAASPAVGLGFGVDRAAADVGDAAALDRWWRSAAREAAAR